MNRIIEILGHQLNFLAYVMVYTLPTVVIFNKLLEYTAKKSSHALLTTEQILARDSGTALGFIYNHSCVFAIIFSSMMAFLHCGNIVPEKSAHNTIVNMSMEEQPGDEQNSSFEILSFYDSDNGERIESEDNLSDSFEFLSESTDTNSDVFSGEYDSSTGSEFFSREDDFTTDSELSSENDDSSTDSEVSPGEDDSSPDSEVSPGEDDSSTDSELCSGEDDSSTDEELCSEKDDSCEDSELSSGAYDSHTDSELFFEEDESSTDSELFSEKVESFKAPQIPSLTTKKAEYCQVPLSGKSEEELENETKIIVASVVRQILSSDESEEETENKTDKGFWGEFNVVEKVTVVQEELHNKPKAGGTCIFSSEESKYKEELIVQSIFLAPPPPPGFLRRNRRPHVSRIFEIAERSKEEMKSETDRTTTIERKLADKSATDTECAVCLEEKVEKRSDNTYFEHSCEESENKIEPAIKTRTHIAFAGGPRYAELRAANAQYQKLPQKDEKCLVPSIYDNLREIVEEQNGLEESLPAEEAEVAEKEHYASKSEGDMKNVSDYKYEDETVKETESAIKMHRWHELLSRVDHAAEQKTEDVPSVNFQSPFEESGKELNKEAKQDLFKMIHQILGLNYAKKELDVNNGEKGRHFSSTESILILKNMASTDLESEKISLQKHELMQRKTEQLVDLFCECLQPKKKLPYRTKQETEVNGASEELKGSPKYVKKTVSLNNHNSYSFLQNTVIVNMPGVQDLKMFRDDAEVPSILQ